MAVLREGQTQLNVRVSSDLYRTIKHASIDRRMTLEAVVEHALTEWVVAGANSGNSDAGAPTRE